MAFFLAFSCNLPNFPLNKVERCFQLRNGIRIQLSALERLHIKWHKLWKNHRGIDPLTSKATRRAHSATANKWQLNRLPAGQRRYSHEAGVGGCAKRYEAVRGDWGRGAAGQSHNEVISGGQWASVFNCQWMPHQLLTFCGYLGNSCSLRAKKVAVASHPGEIRCNKMRCPENEFQCDALAIQMPILMAIATMELI